MSELLPFIVSGLTTGAVFGLAGTGLVLTYKTSGIFNFGHGALATAGAYVFYWLYVDHELDWKIAFVVSVFVAGPLLGLFMERIARRLAHQRPAWKIVGTAGLILLVQGLGTVKYGRDALRVDQYLPGGRDTFRVLDVNISYAQLTIFGLSIATVLALSALFRFSRLGIAMRAVVDDPDLLDLQGTSPRRVRRISWMIGSTLAAMSGVLIVPFLGLEPILLTFLVVQAFGAAAIGRFESLPWTFAGGLLIGILTDVAKKYEFDFEWMRGLSASLPFLVLFAFLLVIPKRRLIGTSAGDAAPPLQWHGPARLRIGAGVIVFGLLAAVPLVVDIKLPFWIIALTQMITILSLGLLVRTAGIVSLCTTAFAAIGAVAFSQLVVDAGVPWVPALALAGLFAVPAGAIVAIPAIRLSGMFLALATLGFGIMVERFFYAKDFMFTELASGRRVPRPSFATTDFRYYYVVLACVLLSVAAVAAIHRGRLGRILRGMGEAPKAVSTLGLSTNVTRVIVFCIAAYMAAIAGALYGAQIGFAVSEDIRYQAFMSIILLAILALAPFRQPWYAVFAGITALIPAYWEGENTVHWLNVVFGAFALLVSLEGGPLPMPGRLQAFFDRVGGPKTLRLPAPVAAAPSAPPIRPAAGDGSGLAVDNLTVRFGGLVAVDGLSLAAPLGRITGLIGPNGAGKTTTFDACSGLNRPSAGRVLLHGIDVSNRSPSDRARAGLGRTFQIMELGDSLTVAENVALGREASQAGRNPVSQLVAPPHHAAVRASATAEALELCGIAHLADKQAGSLSTGQRRLVELARCLAGPFDVLLLDEPSSGLDRHETERFGELLRRIVDERGCAILLVEHDMSLVMEICSSIYVLDFGRLLFEGTPEQVAGSDEVQAAYLGADVGGGSGSAGAALSGVTP